MKKEAIFHRPYFANPISGGADPCIARDTDGWYYYVSARTDGIYLFRSRTLTDHGVPTRVFTFPCNANGDPVVKGIWAPEIHHIGDKWYIYFTASKELPTMESWHLRRMYAIRASRAAGPYEDLTELSLDEHMSIDGTVLEMPNKELYMVYMRNASPCKPQKHDPTAHHNKLYIAKMSDPMHVESKPVLLTAPEYPWEGEICEGPFPLLHDKKICLLYSANAAHLPDYCIGLLTCINPQKPMDTASWKKSPRPIFKSEGNVYGVGHASVVASPDGKESWLVYHSKHDKSTSIPEGWARVVNVKKIEWNDDGTPNLGVPPQNGEKIPLPSGESDAWEEGDSIVGSAFSLKDMLQPYAQSPFLTSTEAGIKILHRLYPTKLVFRRYEWKDAEVVGEMITDTAEFETGLIARASYVSVGHNRVYGYLALFKGHEVTLWRCDGEVRIKLAYASCVSPNSSFRASLRAEGDRLTVYLDGKEVVNATDCTYSHGRMGFYCDADTQLQYVEVHKLKHTLQ